MKNLFTDENRARPLISYYMITPANTTQSNTCFGFVQENEVTECKIIINSVKQVFEYTLKFAFQGKFNLFFLELTGFVFEHILDAAFDCIT